jgi:hypothetical protein
MVQTIRSRFDPPLGTKGVVKEVHYEPVEKVKGSVKAGREAAEEEIKAHKVLEADGSRGIEIEGQRTVRTRRKA